MDLYTLSGISSGILYITRSNTVSGKDLESDMVPDLAPHLLSNMEADLVPELVRYGTRARIRSDT